MFGLFLFPHDNVPEHKVPSIETFPVCCGRRQSEHQTCRPTWVTHHTAHTALSCPYTSGQVVHFWSPCKLISTTTDRIIFNQKCENVTELKWKCQLPKCQSLEINFNVSKRSRTKIITDLAKYFKSRLKDEEAPYYYYYCYYYYYYYYY